MIRRPQVHGAFQRLREERRPSLRPAIHRAFRALVLRKLNSGADRPNVFLGEELGMRKGNRYAGDVRVAFASVQACGECGVSAALGPSFEAKTESWSELQGPAPPHLEP